jgi:16S rRNA (uracil1498-N3)-methyltransferase
MPLPFFYKEDIAANTKTIVLDEDTSKHVVQVLRMQNGEQLQLTDGKGNLFTCDITDNNRKRCAVNILTAHHSPLPTQSVSIAISLLKNTTRFEWFLEKATEIGVTEIIPLICERTEKTAFKFERLNSILISAMLQSQQTWLPLLHQPQQINNIIIKPFSNCTKYIAHCESEESKIPLTAHHSPLTNKLILIGPEGDFTKQEIALALQHNFTAVSLGNTRLRTETAGVVAATLLSSNRS